MKKISEKKLLIIIITIALIFVVTLISIWIYTITSVNRNVISNNEADVSQADDVDRVADETEGTVIETDEAAIETEDMDEGASTKQETEEPVAQQEEPDALPEQLNIPVWITTSGVNLRSEPNTDCEILQTLGRRTELVLQYEKDGWGAVTYEDITGFVSTDYLTKEEPTVSGFVVVIDPGHQAKGDSTPEPNGPNSSTMKARVTGGTSGRTTGVAEYVLTLDISLKLRDELESRGYTVYMTRETHDVNISNMERAQYATSVGADIAVRIHANGVDNSSVSGALALAPSSGNPYIANLSSDSQTLSKCILDSYCSATGMKNQGVTSSDTMTGINWSTVPVTILEMGYMTNPADDVNMEDAAYQQKMVQGIANGIDEYFGL